MPRRDFFAFCTTLKPVELKALGELSHVRHLQKGETIYESGEYAGEIYSINRGVVELTRAMPSGPAERTYLARGDIFGLAETLAIQPRTHSAQAQDLVSLQCFERINFNAIARRVPSFFIFLCEQMALRLQQSSASTATSVCQQLSGSLANFDLVTIHQTIICSGQTGELSVSNESGERIATFFFEDGAPRSGQFQHLTGEEAFWQLFLAEDMPGTFSFSAGSRPMSDCLQAAEIRQAPNELLLSAMQFRDELFELKKSIPEGNMPLQRFADEFHWSQEADARLRELAEKIWRQMGHGRVTIDQLFRQNAVCELKIYLALTELLRGAQIAIVDESARLAQVS